jgi:hypothetical protein
MAVVKQMLFLLCILFITSCGEFSDGQHQIRRVQSSGMERLQLANSLSEKHTRTSFRALLDLLRDSNPDVSNAAAEALEKRGDVAYIAELMSTIPRVDRENRCPAYRALRKYPAIVVVRFLIESLKEELDFYRGKSQFDERNCFYICTSTIEIASSLWKVNDLSLPEAYSLASYGDFYEKALSHERFER